MAIIEERQGTVVEYSVSERLDAVSSIVLDAKTSALPRQFNKIIFNFKNLEYISSMGLRSVLKAYKITASRKGCVSFKNVPPQIRRVFEMSGFIETIVRDEKLAIIQKSRSQRAVSFALVGGLEKTKATELKTKWDILQGDGLKELNLDCEKLTSVTEDAGQILIDIKNEIIKGQGIFEMENISDAVKANLREFGLVFK
ncbi:MAG: hypothetical protein Ta2G_19850 [Termitinemataceae bacterium]|nr:MAG: hypothetical protein Ta2G_19850 [Termitinemataceae bacterium]